MTTNYPTPVDGDVQAHQMPVLTEQQREDALKVALRMSASNSMPSLNDHRYSQLFAEIALAALTTEPLAATEKHEISNMQATGLYLRAWPTDRQLNEKEGYTVKLYTTPPAQLLRPVELPGGFSPAIGDIFDRQAPVMRRDKEDGEWLHKVTVADLLRSLGHEVK